MREPTGAVAWMARNPIAANLLMILVMVSGFYGLSEIRKEVFPTFPSEQILVVVPYPGSTPTEVEEGVVVKVEEAIQGLPGIEEIASEAREGSAVITIDLVAGSDIDDVMGKIKTRLDGISSFPAEVESPVIEDAVATVRLVNLTIYGPASLMELRKRADLMREELLRLPEITQVKVEGERDYEITLEFSENALRQYHLRLDDVVSRIRQQSRDLPGGKIRTEGQTITLRSTGQARTAEAYGELVLLSRPDGRQVRVKDVARVMDGFEDQPALTEFNGLPAITLQVQQLATQNALVASAAVEKYAAEKQPGLPQGIALAVWADRTAVLKSRIELLLTNAVQGAILVMLSLALFLRPQVAFWVVMGIPFCFLGTLAIMVVPSVDLSINVISLFGFILVLGIVVDDAIVTAESACYRLEKEKDGLNSIIRGVDQVTVATVFGVVTTIIAFVPMLLQTEGMSRFFSTAAAVVIFCLALSIIETKFILPAHLANLAKPAPAKRNPVMAWLDRLQQRCSNGLVHFAEFRYGRFLSRCLEYRYITLAVFLGILLICSQLVPSGVVRFVFFPNVPSDYIEVELKMPQGTPASRTHEVGRVISQAGFAINARYRQESGSQDNAIDNISLVSTDDTTAKLRAALVPSTDRSTTSVQLAKWWREEIGEVSGVESISFKANTGHNSLPIDIRFSGDNLETLRNVAEETKAALRSYDGVVDIRDTFESGAPEVDIRITPQGEALGLGQAELARQVRQAFFGAEVQRVQRGRHEVRVYARFPASERNTLDRLRDMRIRLPNGSDVPFPVVGEIIPYEGINKITRIDRERVVSVQADADKQRVNPGEILVALQAKELKAILARHPGVKYELAGQAEEQKKNESSLTIGTLLTLLMIYAALAIPLRSWGQPFLIMLVIPFALQGAVLGHLIMGKEISIISIIGMVALAGIAVNDALVLIDYVNQKVAGGMEWREAVASSGVRRFRAVFLTSLTTFAGLLPIQLETSIQAQFLKPMAISVAFGIVLSTVVTLLLVPVICFIIDDVRRAVRSMQSSGQNK